MLFIYSDEKREKKTGAERNFLEKENEALSCIQFARTSFISNILVVIATCDKFFFCDGNFNVICMDSLFHRFQIKYFNGFM